MAVKATEGEIEENTAPKRVTFRLSEDLFNEVTWHVERQRKTTPKYSLNDACIKAVSALASPRSPLTRYQTLLSYGRKILRDTFGENELNLIMDACNGFSLMMEMTTERSVYTYPGNAIALEVQDSVRLDKTDKKWSVKDGKELVRRIEALDIVAQYALVDLIERFWDDPNAGSVIQLL